MSPSTRERVHGRELFVERDVGTGEATEIDHRHPVDLQAAEIGFDSGVQLLGALGRQPLGLIVPGGTDLRHQHQLLGVRVQSGVDEFIGHVRAVELGGVDVVHTGLDGPTEDGHGDVAVGRRSEHTGSRELHGTEPDTVDGTAGERDGWAGHKPRLTLAPLTRPAARSAKNLTTTAPPCRRG